MTDTKPDRYDVAIIGGGIGGSTLAAILARQGLSTVLLEGSSHPRFAIGESSIPETSMLMRILAARYDVPELAYLSTYNSILRHVSSNCGVKRNFSYFHHVRDEPADPRSSNQFLTFGPPLGPESHLFRQDTDSWLYWLALRYGAHGVTNAQVTDVDVSGDEVSLGCSDGRKYRARYVVDAGGIRALLPAAMGLRDQPCPFQTRSRSIFTHMTGVLPWERVVPGSAHRLPSPTSQGTLHHFFDGGWMWVIPFDNHPRGTNRLCSVGISLDASRHPSTDAPAEDEFWDIVSRFPSVASQFRDARPARGFASTTRNQFSSARHTGPRWFLLPHASTFVDPLFSSGLSVTFWALNHLAAAIIGSIRTGSFDLEPYAWIESWISDCFRYYDTLVSRTYTCFGDFELWNAWYRIWILASLYGNSGLIGVLSRARGGIDDPAWDMLRTAPYRGLQCVDNPAHAALLTAAVTEVDRYADGLQPAAQAAERIYQHIADSQLTPRPLPLLDPAVHAPAKTFTLAPLSRLRLWGVHAPEQVRGSYFNSGVKLSTRLLAGSVHDETSDSVSGVRHLLRDTFVSWNRDWRPA